MFSHRAVNFRPQVMRINLWAHKQLLLHERCQISSKTISLQLQLVPVGHVPSWLSKAFFFSCLNSGTFWCHLTSCFALHIDLSFQWAIFSVSILFDLLTMYIHQQMTCGLWRPHQMARLTIGVLLRRCQHEWCKNNPVMTSPYDVIITLQIVKNCDVMLLLWHYIACYHMMRYTYDIVACIAFVIGESITNAVINREKCRKLLDEAEEESTYLLTRSLKRKLSPSRHLRVMNKEHLESFLIQCT